LSLPYALENKRWYSAVLTAVLMVVWSPDYHFEIFTFGT
jgi:hypothetical protein